MFRRSRYASVARLRLTGDDLWKLDGLLYPEMLGLAPAALREWPAGEDIVRGQGPHWRWKLTVPLSARSGNWSLLRRTLADCTPGTLGQFASIDALRGGMLRFYRRCDEQPIRVRPLRRLESKARLASQLLPTRIQHLGTRLWYRLAR